MPDDKPSGHRPPPPRKGKGSMANTNRVAIGRLYESAAKYRCENLRSAIENGRILIDGRPLRKKEVAVLLDALGSDSSDSGFGVVVVPGQAPQFGFK